MSLLMVICIFVSKEPLCYLSQDTRILVLFFIMEGKALWLLIIAQNQWASTDVNMEAVVFALGIQSFTGK